MNQAEQQVFLKSNKENSSEQEEYDTKPEKIINYRQFLGLIVGFLHSASAGMTNSYASVILAQNKDNKTLIFTKEQASWILSIVVLPMIPGSLLSGLLQNIVRKKVLLLIISIMEVISWFLLYNSTTVTSILVARAINGMAIAMGSPIIPQFLAEISHAKIRVGFLSIVALGLSIGLLIMHTWGALFAWNTCALIATVPMVAYFLLILYLPETYVWHIRHGNIEEAEEAFYWYRGRTSSSEREMEKLIAHKEQNISGNYTKVEMLRLCCSKLLLMPLGIALVGMATMQLSGIKAIMFYSITIISQAIPSLNEYTSSIVVDVVRTVMAVIGSYLLNKYPVRPLFIVSGVGSAISHFCFSVFFFYVGKDNTSQVFSILSLLALISYTIFSSIGIAPLSWVIAGEIFPLIVKGVGSGIFTFAYYITFFIAVKFIPDLFDLFGISGAFVFYGCCTALGTIVMYFILPETKNKTLKEIEDLFR